MSDKKEYQLRPSMIGGKAIWSAYEKVESEWKEIKHSRAIGADFCKTKLEEIIEQQKIIDESENVSVYL